MEANPINDSNTMAANKGKDPVSGQFLPGHKYGKGRIPYPKEVLKFKQELRSCIVETLSSDTSVFKKIKENPNATLMEIIVARFAQEACKGSTFHFQFLLDRTIGKPKESSTKGEENTPEVIEMIPKEKLLALVTEHYDNKRLTTE